MVSGREWSLSAVRFALVAVLVVAGCGQPAEPDAAPTTTARPTTTTSEPPPPTTAPPTTVPEPAVFAVGEEMAERYRSRPEVTDEVLDRLVTFHFADDVTEEERQSTREWMKAALRYWADREVPVTIWTGKDDAWMAGAYVAAFDGASRASAEAIYATPEPQLGIAGPGSIVHQIGTRMPDEVLIHEYVHVIQGSLSGRRGDQYEECWLTEGSARFYGNLLASAWRTPKWDIHRAYGQADTLSGPSVLEAGCDGYGYNVGALAVEYLWHRFGEASIITFFESYRLGVPWQDAFRTAFGIDPEQFATEFDAHRNELLAAQ